MSKSALLERKRGDTGIVKIERGAVEGHPDEELVIRYINNTITHVRCQIR